MYFYVLFLRCFRQKYSTHLSVFTVEFLQEDKLCSLFSRMQLFCFLQVPLPKSRRSPLAIQLKIPKKGKVIFLQILHFGQSRKSCLSLAHWDFQRKPSPFKIRCVFDMKFLCTFLLTISVIFVGRISDNKLFRVKPSQYTVRMSKPLIYNHLVRTAISLGFR